MIFKCPNERKTHYKTCLAYQQTQRRSKPKKLKTDSSSTEEWSDFEENQVQISTENWKAMYSKILSDSNVSVQVIRNYESSTTAVYGEALPNLIRLLIHLLNLTSSNTFYDIGSGIGSVITQVAAQTGCKTMGIEFRSDLHNYATAIKHSYIKHMRAANLNPSEVVLIEGDVLDEIHDVHLRECTVTFMNNVCYGADLELQLLNKFQRWLQHGTRVVTMKELFPCIKTVEAYHNKLRKDPCHPLALFKFPWQVGHVPNKGAVSWTGSPVTYHIYQVDRRLDQSALVAM